jgi:uncharacterized membrane protein
MATAEDGQQVGRRTVVVALVAALAVVASSCTIALGDLGGRTSVAHAINEAGVIVGSSELPGSTDSNRIERAFERTPDGTVVELPSLPGTTRSVANAINDAGVIVGTATVGVAPDQQTHLVRWNIDGTVDDLGVVGPAFTTGTPTAIDDEGRIVGNRKTAAGNRAYVYDPAVGHLVDLPVIPGDTSTAAYGMNDEGDVVGSGNRPWSDGVQTSVEAPVRWDLDAWTVTDLEPLWGRGLAFDINDAGTITGVWLPDPSGFPIVGVISRQGQTVAVIDSSFLLSVNDHDVVVGYRWDVSGGRFEALRWEDSTGTVMLEAHNSAAEAVNDRGQIVGQHDRHAALFAPTGAP